MHRIVYIECIEFGAFLKNCVYWGFRIEYNLCKIVYVECAKLYIFFKRCVHWST